MNWQAVVDMLREDVSAQTSQMHASEKEGDAMGATIAGTSAIVLSSLANALQMGINKRNET